MSIRLTLIAAWLFFISTASYAGIHDFDLTNSYIDISDLQSGGPPKDGIPAILAPKFARLEQIEKIRDEEFVVGLTVDGESRAYPIRILNWHEIVNDVIADHPIAVTYCPLTKSALVFDRRVQGETLEFGVSGLLYNSNVVLYDRNHQGLWSQLKMGGLTGPYSSDQLWVIPSVVTTLKEWRSKNPETLVLTDDTGYWRNYDSDPYNSYHSNNHIMFSVKGKDNRLSPKELVLGLSINGIAKAYPLKKIRKLGTPIKDTIAGLDVLVFLDHNDAARIEDTRGKLLPGIVVYWFAWNTFHPDTLVYQGDDKAQGE